MPNTPKETLKSLNLEVVEFQTLAERCQDIIAKLNQATSTLDSNERQSRSLLQKLHEQVMDFLCSLFKKRRQPPADHVLVILLSDERHSKKPYALPCSYYPYSSLNDAYVRDLTRKIKIEMTNQNLTVVGKFLIQKHKFLSSFNPYAHFNV